MRAGTGEEQPGSATGEPGLPRSGRATWAAAVDLAGCQPMERRPGCWRAGPRSIAAAGAGAVAGSAEGWAEDVARDLEPGAEAGPERADVAAGEEGTADRGRARRRG